MKVKCGYCGSFIDDTAEVCPNCGAVNEHVMRSADGIPKTIEQLKAFCKAKNLPLKEMRFFIGEDFKEPKAFGIFKDSDGSFVVYKNKGSGARAERYRGKDEAYAVNEIYQKLRSEIQIRREHNAAKNAAKAAPTSRNTKKRPSPMKIAIIIFIAVAALLCIFCAIDATNTPNNGYYKYNDNYYYCQDDSWYYYDAGAGYWYAASAIDSALNDNYSDYYEGSSYNGSGNITDFSDTSYYNEITNNSDYNDDWDGGDWDRAGGGWDADLTGWDADLTDWDTDW
ncbi:MAG: zinc ribbon domain-containing protein [Oscillospiraceae bacterium]